MASARDSFFNYLPGSNRSAPDISDEDLMAAIEARLGTPLGATTTEDGEKKGTSLSEVGRPIKDEFGFPTERVKTAGSSVGKLSKLLSEYGIRAQEDISKLEEYEKKSAPEYAKYLASLSDLNQLTPTEASQQFLNFASKYGIEGGYKTAAELAARPKGVAPTSAVERFRPYQQMAAKTLGISLSEEDIKGTEAAALALNKTTPEAFADLLGKRMLASPEYIRKTPLAFTANLPFGGKYGVGYQTPEGTFTGTYRFKPPTTVNYS